VIISTEVDKIEVARYGDEIVVSVAVNLIKINRSMRTERRTDMTKLIFTFRSFANAPNKTKSKEFTKEIMMFHNLPVIVGCECFRVACYSQSFI
jgi:hypothetical protein